MFKVTNRGDTKVLSSTIILDNVNIGDFINKKALPTETALCPTFAIDVSNEKISQDKCISCGICWIKAPDSIQFDGNYNINRFLGYCEGNKLFVYKWFSLTLLDYCGNNIKSKGFSRTKRIPLIVMNDKTAYIVKAAHTSKDIERVYHELGDIVTLSKIELEQFRVQKVIVVINFYEKDRDFLGKFSDSVFLSLGKVLDNLLTKKYRNMEEHIKFSRC